MIVVYEEQKDDMEDGLLGQIVTNSYKTFSVSKMKN